MANKTPPKRGRGRPKKTPLVEPVPVQDEVSPRLKLTSRLNLKQWKNFIIAVIILVGFGLLTWQYLQTRNEVRRLSNQKNESQSTSEEIIGQVAKVAVLPEGEEPTIADVNDVSKLQDKPFFMLAKNGDKVLLYTKARRAVLYRPSTKQIVNIADLTAQDTSPTQ